MTLFKTTLSYRADFAPLLKLAIPLVLAGITQSSMNFFENIFLAQLGPHALAAGALVAWFYATLIVIAFGLFSSINVLVAHKYGEQDVVGISHVVRDGITVALAIAIPALILIWNITPILLVLGQQPEIVDLATAYFHALAWGLLPQLIFIVLFETLLGLGHARTTTVFTMLVIPIYILFSYGFIFGKFGLPQLGIAGAGWGLAVGDWIAAILMSLYLFTSKQYRPYFASLFRYSGPSYRWEILHLGVPMGIMYCVEVGFFFAMTLLMGLFGVHALAANQLTMQYLGPLMNAIFCLAQAITTRMGHELGAKQIEPAKRAAQAGVFLSIITMAVIAIFYWVMPQTLISVDFDVHALKNAETIKLATQFLGIAALFQIFEAARVAYFGALRGLKDTRFTLLISVISFWGLSLPLGALFAFTFKCGSLAFWWAMLVGAIFSFILLAWRFSQKIEVADRTSPRPR